MKARVIATGDIVDVIPYNRDGFAYIQDDGETVYEFHELEILDDPNYWTRLEHQAAIAAMQGMCMNPQYPDKSWDAMAGDAANAAQALVEKYKKEEK